MSCSRFTSRNSTPNGLNFVVFLSKSENYCIFKIKQCYHAVPELSPIWNLYWPHCFVVKITKDVAVSSSNLDPIPISYHNKQKRFVCSRPTTCAMMAARVTKELPSSAPTALSSTRPSLLATGGTMWTVHRLSNTTSK